MAEFSFQGDLGASKSLFNRALIVASYSDQLKIKGQSQSDDVDLMKRALADLGEKREFDCGEAGTVLRFLAFRLAREKGLFRLNGSKRLFQRLFPQLQQCLSQLGAESRLISDQCLELNCDAWRLRGDGLWIPSGESSQFASGIILNSWRLDSPLHFVRSGALVSDAYFQMTLDLVRNFGMQVETFASEVSVQAGQEPQGQDYIVECDASSAFAVAALAALAGQCRITNFPERPQQPDAIFITHLIRMGVPVEQTKAGLHVEKAVSLEGISVDLKNTPDLFPVLATLCCFARGVSKFTGLSHLVHKESNRVEKVRELTEALGAHWEGDERSELLLHPPVQPSEQKISIDVSEDHRLAMASAVAQAGGGYVETVGSGSISKSFQDFHRVWPLS